ncbi:hypothetical protein PAXRUDRAFT_648680 [Paxillus rubicundulus Ve08.2h10]|uniref:Uncharacterized protein n=1 Tax=Paxillus rubicundulus Ve08.2h10 TaxID=930991 RepID=A0A0D0D3N5_9AGAM|nr:hypothetical protein PAXRUDRAFT_648680 [Paxillus rubicundulus Ve08.2h10]
MQRVVTSLFATDRLPGGCCRLTRPSSTLCPTPSRRRCGGTKMYHTDGTDRRHKRLYSGSSIFPMATARRCFHDVPELCETPTSKQSLPGFQSSQVRLSSSTSNGLCLIGPRVPEFQIGTKKCSGYTKHLIN